MKPSKLLSSIIALALCATVLGAQDKPIRFALFSDLHYSEGSQSVNDLRACVRDVNSIGGIDFVLVAGDLTDFGSDEELAAVKGILDSLAYDYYVVAGNHDAKWSESGCDTFKNIFGYESFEFKKHGWRFIGCNSGPDMRMAPALIPRESMEWLKSLEPGEPTVFLNHYPQDTSVLNYFDVTRELKRIGTRLEVGGHWHNNTILDYDGIPGVLGRSTLKSRNSAGYNLFTMEDGHVTARERRVFDSSSVLLEPWYEADLKEIKDTVKYDKDGLPASYPWMRYDVNEDNPVREAWKIKEDSNIAAGFARDGKYAYYATESGFVKCRSLKDGSLKWKSSFPGKIFSTPALEGKILVFGCADGFIYALNAKDGKTLWKVKAGKSVLGSPEIFDGKAFIGASDGVFRAIDLKSGEVAWEYAGVKGFVECKPFVDKSQVVFGTWGNKLYSLDTGTGKFQWEWTCEKPSRMYSPAAVWPVKSDGKIFIAVPDRRLYVLDSSTGKELKHFDMLAREAVGISEDGNTVYCKSMWHKLTAIDTKSLDINWQVETGAGYEISPTSIPEINGVGVIMPTDKGNIICFDSESGRKLWAHKLSIALVNPLRTWKEGKEANILASTMDGTIALLKINL